MSDRETCEGSSSVISSPEWACGAMHSDKRDGQMTERSGQVVAPANLSARQAQKLGLMTSGTCGPTSTGSSASADLQSFMESRLQARTRTLGSTLYVLTWKPWVTPSGRSRLRQRASAPRTRESVRTGWPTPTTRDWKDGKGCDNVPANALLGRVVWLAGWATPTTLHNKRTEAFAAGRTPTPSEVLPTCQPARLTATGKLLTGSSAGMSSGGPLNPAHSRWLMALLPEWDACAPMETLSMLSKPESLLKWAWKPCTPRHKLRTPRHQLRGSN